MFEDIIGHKREKKILQSQLDNNSLNHAYLFTGPEGIGKKELAQDFTLEVINKGLINKDRKISLSHSDIFLYGYNNEKISIKDIRNLKEETITKPLEGSNRVFIIDNADSMNQYAQNALLKTLEEPNPGNIIILISSNPNALLPTIKSRCQELQFHDLNQSEKELLLSKYNIGLDEIDLTQTPGKIINLLEDKDLNDKFNHYLDEFIEIREGDLFKIFNLAETLSKDKEESKQVIEFFIRHLYKEILKDTIPDKKVIKSITILIDLLEKLTYNVNLRLQWENSLIKIYMEQ